MFLYIENTLFFMQIQKKADLWKTKVMNSRMIKKSQ